MEWRTNPTKDNTGILIKLQQCQLEILKWAKLIHFVYRTIIISYIAKP